VAQAAGLCWWKTKNRAKNAKTAAKGSATVPVALSGVPPDESVREDTSGEDAERGGRDARAPQFQKHLHPLANLARLPHNLEKG